MAKTTNSTPTPKTVAAPAAPAAAAKTPAPAPVAAAPVPPAPATAPKAPAATPAPAAAPAIRAEPKAGPTYEQIARRAYEIYQARGADHGRHQDDWTQAERELKLGKQ